MSRLRTARHAAFAEGRRYIEASTDLRVRFQEIDSMHVVWHGHYITYFEEARRLVGEVDEAEAHLRHGERTLSGPLRVATAVGYGLRVLLPLELLLL